MFEDLEPRPARGAPSDRPDARGSGRLFGRGPEGADRRAGGRDRPRRKAAIDGKSSQRNAADAMFNFRS